jgi:4-hydroxy-tetrahydrodipicolinate reductase
MTVRFIQYGLGPIGCSICRLALDRGFELVGAIDVDPEKAGRDVGEVIGLDKPTGVIVSDNPQQTLSKKADVVLHSTSSSLEKIKDQILDSIRSGKNFVSTSEELSFPLDIEIRNEIDDAAKENKVSVLGTGVNPGFVLDKLILVMTGVCHDIQKVTAKRIVDASKRRPQLQQKIGAGLTVEEFMEGVKIRAIKHVGLPESVSMIASGTGHEIDRIEESIEPVIAQQDGSSDFIKVRRGDVLGIKQTCTGTRHGKPFIELELQMYLGAESPGDYIRIEGKPPIELDIPGGIHGDLATSAMVINAVPSVIKAEPGLLTMKDIPVSIFRKTD